MTASDLKTLLIETLIEVAPDLEASEVPLEQDLREALDIDSMDFLNYVTALHEKLGVAIPEDDYPKLFTISGGIAYLAEKLAPPRGPDGRAAG